MYCGHSLWIIESTYASSLAPIQEVWFRIQISAASLQGVYIFGLPSLIIYYPVWPQSALQTLRTLDTLALLNSYKHLLLLVCTIDTQNLDICDSDRFASHLCWHPVMVSTTSTCICYARSTDSRDWPIAQRYRWIGRLRNNRSIALRARRMITRSLLKPIAQHDLSMAQRDAINRSRCAIGRSRCASRLLGLTALLTQFRSNHDFR